MQSYCLITKNVWGLLNKCQYACVEHLKSPSMWFRYCLHVLLKSNSLYWKLDDNCQVCLHTSLKGEKKEEILWFFILLHRSVKFTFKMCQNQGGHLTFNLIGSFIVQVGQFWCQPTVLNVFVAVLMFQYVQRVPCENISSLGVKAWTAGDWEWKAQFVSWQRPDPSTWPWTWPQQARL